MQLFQLIRNPQFFSLLSSPNREIYVEALFVVFRCYKQELLIRRQDLVDRLVAALEDRMFELADEEGDAIDDGSLSGRAHWLLRRMFSCGMLDFVDAENVEDVREHVGALAMGEKNGKQRMVVNCRRSHCWFAYQCCLR